MAKLEAGRKSSKYMVKSITPDVCLTPPNMTPVPYNITIKLGEADKVSPNVNLKKEPAAIMSLVQSPVTGDEAGTGGGVVSGVNKGWCRPATFCPTVKASGHHLLYDQDTFCLMNCAGPKGPANALGKLHCLDDTSPGPAAKPGQPDAGDPPLEMTAEEASKFGGNASLVSKILNTPGMTVNLAKMAYGVVENGFTPEAVLGGLGSIAGIAGYSNLAKAANIGLQAKQLASTDWSNPAAALAALGGAAGLGGSLASSNALAQVSKQLNTFAKGVNAVQRLKSNKAGAMALGVNTMSNARVKAQSKPGWTRQLQPLIKESGNFRNQAKKAQELKQIQGITPPQMPALLTQQLDAGMESS